MLCSDSVTPASCPLTQRIHPHQISDLSEEASTILRGIHDTHAQQPHGHNRPHQSRPTPPCIATSTSAPLPSTHRLTLPLFHLYFGPPIRHSLHLQWLSSLPLYLPFLDPLLLVVALYRRPHHHRPSPFDPHSSSPWACTDSDVSGQRSEDGDASDADEPVEILRVVLQTPRYAPRTSGHFQCRSWQVSPAALAAFPLVRDGVLCIRTSGTLKW